MLGLSVLRNEDSPESVGTLRMSSDQCMARTMCNGSTPRGALMTLPRYVWPLLDEDFVVST